MKNSAGSKLAQVPLTSGTDITSPMEGVYYVDEPMLNPIYFLAASNDVVVA